MSQIIKCRVAAINASASGDNTLVAAVSGSPITVWKAWFVNTAAVNFKFKDGAAIDFHPAAVLSGNGSVFFAYDGQPYFTTTLGNALILNLSGAVQCSGVVYYTLG